MEVYIVLTDTGTWLSKAIKLFTRKPLNHASISFTKELDTVYSFGRKRPNNPFIGGFVKENMRGVLFQESQCEIYRLSITDTQFRQMNECISTIEKEQEKYRYNFMGLFSVLMEREWDRDRAYFCSEFVAAVLKEANVRITDKPVSLVKPSDFTECEELELVYAGKLSFYLTEQTENPTEMIRMELLV